MPDLGNNPSLSSPLAVAHGGSDLKSAPLRSSVEAPLPSSPKSLGGAPGCEPAREKNLHLQNGGAAPRRNGARTLEDYVGDWAQRKMGSGEARYGCFLPFLVGAKRMVKCVICHRFICPDEELQCVVRGCNGTYHSSCAKERLGKSNLKNFKCPQHACFICKQRPPHWRCVLCTIASHYKCAAWPEKVMHLKNPPGRAVCWRHLTNSRITYLMNEQHAFSTSDVEEIFGHLPTPYDEEEFKFDITMKDMIENKMEPPPYGHIRRNIYLTRKKRDDVGDGIGCSSCSSMCSENCVCRVQCISCSKACRCPENCNNRPFRKDKKIKIVKTELCGWGVEAAESINKGEFIVEYIGEVIDDALCEKRLWDMKFRGMKNFYMCEVRKDFTIDATFKGNASRFLNHSCDPNCFLEKWQVEGETRVGVFAARSIKVGEPLTYDYRFVQFGPEVECHCGSQNCQGYLGTKKKIAKLEVCWGSKRRRTTAACVAILTL